LKLLGFLIASTTEIQTLGFSSTIVCGLKSPAFSRWWLSCVASICPVTPIHTNHPAGKGWIKPKRDELKEIRAEIVAGK
jgi:hypothetical protein